METATYQIRAIFDEHTIRVYQAFCAEIADSAISAQKLVPPFKIDRMTWIKPSFNWIMYRSGFATKPNQERILAIDITREGFEWALQNAILTTYCPKVHKSYEDWKSALKNSPVRAQWDPERNWKLEQIPNVRSLQIGLSGDAVKKYTNEWIKKITDVTASAIEQKKAVFEKSYYISFQENGEKIYQCTFCNNIRI